MTARPVKPEYPSAAELREILPTVIGAGAAGDPFATRLQYVADLLAKLGRLPAEPVLAWRETNGAVRHIAIGQELVVGRNTNASGLSLAEDELLSRSHFVIRTEGPLGTLEDLASRNGTAVNTSENRATTAKLCDGDLIYAGRHIFVYLNPNRV